MSAAKHTPGPWKVCYDGQIDGANGEFVCAFRWESFKEFNEGNNAANARLIEMAPTMLEALVEAAGTLQGAAECMRKVGAPRTADKLEEIALAAMLVVAKATGAAA